MPFHVVQEFRSQPKDLGVVFAAATINRLGTMAVPFLPLYLIDSLHFSAVEAGAVLSAFGFGSLVTTVFAGWLSDRFGALRLMFLSLVASGVVLAVFPFVRSAWAVWLVVVALSVATESFRPAMYSAGARLANPDRKQMGFAILRFGVNLGMSIGPATGGFLARYSFSALFWINAVTSFVAAAVVFFRLHHKNTWLLEQSSSDPGERRHVLAGTWEVLRDRRMLLLTLGMIPVMMVFFQHESSMPIYMVKYLQLDEKFYGLMFTFNTILILFLEIPLNRATQHWPFSRQFFLASACVAVGFGILAVWQSVVGIFVSVFIWTFGEMMLFPALGAYVDRLAPKGKMGMYLGVQGASFASALMLGSWLGVLCLDRLGPRALWSIALVLAGFSTFWLRRVAVLERPVPKPVSE